MKRTGFLTLLLVLAGCDLFPPPGGSGPRVGSVRPAEGAANVAVGSRIVATLELPNGGVDLTTANAAAVRLVDVRTGEAVAASVFADNDAERLTLTPAGELGFGTPYRFEVTPGVVDDAGRAFAEHRSTFTTVPENVPSVIRSRPGDGDADVPVDAGVSTDLNGVVDRTSVGDGSVYLLEAATGERVPGQPGYSGGDDTFNFTPSRPLETNTAYTFNVTSAVRDVNGAAFVPYTATFTTGGDAGPAVPTGIVSVPQPTAAGERHTSLTFGPDGNLYAATLDGRIRRYPVAADGTLGVPATIRSLQEAEGGPRLLVGLAFDPASTADDLVLWTTHTVVGDYSGGVVPGVDAPWSGKLTRLSGPDLETVQDVVVGLPRSNKDHVTNSVAFNPREPGVVYFVQGSNTAMGAPDRPWGFQPERALSGAVLRLDTDLLGSLPLDARTEDGGTYNPFAPGAPLTVYGSGTRNSYDLVWHSNGSLYVPANGSARGGVVPRYNPLPDTCKNRPDGGYTGAQLADPADVRGSYVTALPGGQTDGWVITETLNDYLFRVERGGYYGYPNPKRCEWILQGGGAGFPGYESTKVGQYPASVEADPRYRGPAADFGKNVSPNGATEYTGNAFPDLREKLLVVRYANYNDLAAVTLGSDGTATAINPVARGFVDPIDVTQSPATGFLYVSSFDQESATGSDAGITLLRPR